MPIIAVPVPSAHRQKMDYGILRMNQIRFVRGTESEFN